MNLAAKIEHDWSLDPSVMAACLNIYTELSTRSTHPDHYTLNDLELIAKSHDKESLTRAALYLTTPRIRILNICMMYAYNDYLFELPAEEINHYINGNDLIHPETGNPLKKSEVLICFTANSNQERGR